MQEVEKAKKELEEKKEAYKKLKRECQKQKKWIAEYQLLIRAGASGQHKVLNLSTVPSSDHSCFNPYALKLLSFSSFVPFPYYITVMIVSLCCFHFLLFLYPSLISSTASSPPLPPLPSPFSFSPLYPSRPLYSVPLSFPFSSSHHPLSSSASSFLFSSFFFFLPLTFPLCP